MSNIHEAFKIPINSENKEFVRNPYIPMPSLTYPIPPDDFNSVTVTPQPMTVGRCVDIKYGSKSCFMPSYGGYKCGNNQGSRVNFKTRL